jgi:hypothetical protein
MVGYPSTAVSIAAGYAGAFLADGTTCDHRLNVSRQFSSCHRLRCRPRRQWRHQRWRFQCPGCRCR